MSAELQILKEELQNRKTAKRLEIAKELKRAEELGDLFRENFPYDAAVADQRHNETRIVNLERAIQALSVKKSKSKKIQIGCEVELEKDDGSTIKLKLVDEDVFRARIYSNAITTESPLGKEILNKVVGSQIIIKSTNKRYRVISLNFFGN